LKTEAYATHNPRLKNLYVLMFYDYNTKRRAYSNINACKINILKGIGGQNFTKALKIGFI